MEEPGDVPGGKENCTVEKVRKKPHVWGRGIGQLQAKESEGAAVEVVDKGARFHAPLHEEISVAAGTREMVDKGLANGEIASGDVVGGKGYVFIAVGDEVRDEIVSGVNDFAEDVSGHIEGSDSGDQVAGNGLDSWSPVGFGDRGCFGGDGVEVWHWR